MKRNVCGLSVRFALVFSCEDRYEPYEEAARCVYRWRCEVWNKRIVLLPLPPPRPP